MSIRIAKTNVIFFIASLAVTVAPGCTKKESNVAKGNKEQVLHLGNGAEPSDLDPQITTGVPEDQIESALFEGLTAPDPKTLQPEPGVAESWKISADGKTYTFKIRANAKWSNGDKLTAKDFVYSWQRILEPALASEYAYMLYYIDKAEEYNTSKEKDFSKVGVKAQNDQTLEVRLKNSTPFFLSLLSHHSTYPVHKATIEKFGKMEARGTQWTRPGNLVSNGPFTLKQWDMNKVVALAKNENYWDAAAVKLKGVNFYPTDSQQTEEKMFRSGELHHTNEVPLAKIETYKKENPTALRIDPYLGTYFYRVNVTKKPFDNVLVRKALAMAIDRNAIVKRVTKGGQIPAEAFTPPELAGYTANAKLPYDVAQAKKLLAQAGYANGKGFPTTELLFNTSETHKTIAEAVQQMWRRDLNIDITLVNQDWKVYLDSQKQLNYQLSRSAWIGDYLDPNTFLDMFVTGGGNNNTGWSNKEYDVLIKKAGETKDANARLVFFQKAEEILLDEAPIMPVYTYTRVYLQRPEVRGWYANIQDRHPLKYVYLDAPQVASK